MSEQLPLCQTDPAVCVEGLTFHLGGQKLYENVSFTIRHGERVAISGISGCGKTVLCKIIYGYPELRPETGRVLLYGHDVYALSKPELDALHRYTSFVFQHGALLDAGTIYLNSSDVYGNIVAWARARGVPVGDEETFLRDHLRRVGLDYEECWSLQKSQLSGGMQKRLAIARGLVGNPRIIFYDEPTAELDPHSKQIVLETIRQINRREHITTVITTHDPYAQRHMKGRILLIGEKANIAFDGNFYALCSSRDPEIVAYRGDEDAYRLLPGETEADFIEPLPPPADRT